MKRKLELKDITNEIWKDIPDFEGCYQVSQLGEVKRLINNEKYNNRTEKVLKVDKCKFGYCRVNLKRKKYLVHRLVASVFIPNPENKQEVNYINGIKSDNRVENLEWTTRSENTIHAINALGKKSPTEGVVGFENKTGKAISITINGETKLFGSTRQASIELNIPHSTLRYYLSGDKKNKKGKYTNFNIECNYV